MWDCQSTDRSIIAIIGYIELQSIARLLSDNSLKQAQNNTVVVQQEEVDRVGFEPTTSGLKSGLAMTNYIKGVYNYLVYIQG